MNTDPAVLRMCVCVCDENGIIVRRAIKKMSNTTVQIVHFSFYGGGEQFIFNYYMRATVIKLRIVLVVKSEDDRGGAYARESCRSEKATFSLDAGEDRETRATVGNRPHTDR